MSRIERTIVYGLLALLVLHALLGVPLLAPKRAEAGDATADVVRAHKFQLRDANERERAALVLDGDGALHLDLLDANGNLRAWIAVNKDGAPRLGFFDANGKGRTHLDLDSDGAPTLNMSDADGHPLAILGALHGNVKPSATDPTALGLMLFDRKGKVTFQAPK